MKLPIVSICIPTYQGAQFIGSTIQSVLDQNYQRIEINVLDDCSTDDTANLVSKFKDERIHYHRNEVNLGPGANWNRCLEYATGKYYKLLPHDDELLPGSLKAQVDIFESDAEEKIALAFGSRKIVDSRGRLLFHRRPLGNKSRRIESKHLINTCIRSGGNVIGEPGNGLVRSKLLNEVGKYDATYPYLIDLDFWFRVLKHGDAFYDAKAHSVFRVSEHAWSTKIGKKQSHDYRKFIGKINSDPDYQITKFTIFIGALKSKYMVFLRRSLYKLLPILYGQRK